MKITKEKRKKERNAIHASSIHYKALSNMKGEVWLLNFLIVYITRLIVNTRKTKESKTR